MAPRRRPSTRNRVVVIIGGIDFSQKSAADIIRRIKAICDEFQVIILTTTSLQCKTMFPAARVLGFPVLAFRAGVAFFHFYCWLLMPFLRADLVYVADVISSPSAALVVRAPIMCYGNSHPIQHALAARRKGRHLSLIIANLYGKILRHSLRRSDLILAISPQLKNAFESFGVAPEKIRYTGVGVPIEQFHPKSPKPEKERNGIWIGVCHGTVSLDRGLGVMIDGARILAQRRKDFRLRLVGCNEDEARLARQYAKNADVENFVEILPKVPYSEIPGVLSSADWGISLLEPNVYFEASPPIKVLEFLAAGLPVIANRTATHLLFLRDRVNSILISYDPESFANAFQTMIEDSKLRQAMASNALSDSSKHSESQLLQKLICAAQALIDGEGVDNCLGAT